MRGCLASIIAIVLGLVIAILIPIFVSAVGVSIFDWIFGTTFFTPQIVGAVALLLFIVGRFSN